MGELRGNVGSDPKQRQRAVLRTLGMADEAAEREDYLDALAWLGTLDAIGYELSAAYEEVARIVVELRRRSLHELTVTQ